MKALALAVAAATLAGCTFGVAVCQTDLDCSGGARCELTTGVCMSSPVSIVPRGNDAGTVLIALDAGRQVVDAGVLVPPDAGPSTPTGLALILPELPSRPAAGGTVYEDSPRAWRRNESFVAIAQSTRPLSELKLTLGGSELTSVACTSTCVGSCQCFRVDLWLPPLEGMRGNLMLVASGKDPSAVSISAHTSLPVTRLAWSRVVVSGHQIRATPAIGADGTIYVGTTAGPALRTGALVAIAPTGLERWNKPLGRIEASPVLSAPGPSQRLYVGAVETLGGRLYAFNAAGEQQAQCALSPVAALETSPVVLSSGGAAFYSNVSRALISILPGSSPACVSKPTAFEVPFPGNLVADADAVYFADSQPRLRRFTLDHHDNQREWKERTNGQWPAVMPAGFVNRSLALWSSTQLIGAGSTATGGALFQASVGNSIQWDYGFPLASGSVAHQSPVVAAGGIARVGVPTGLAAINGSNAMVGAGDPLRNAPILGQGGRLFALAENGALSQWSMASPPVRGWTAALDPGPAPAFEASPTLDCARDAAGLIVAGRPGTLYAASRSGKLYAVIVDSRGIDASAAWPKYQKDPRNSGNASTSLAEFSCP